MSKDVPYIAGNFHGVQNLAFFEAEQSTRKLKLIPRTGISHAKLLVGVWFPGIKTRILEPTKIYAEGSQPNSKNVQVKWKVRNHIEKGLACLAY